MSLRNLLLGAIKFLFGIDLNHLDVGGCSSPKLLCCDENVNFAAYEVLSDLRFSRCVTLIPVRGFTIVHVLKVFILKFILAFSPVKILVYVSDDNAFPFLDGFYPGSDPIFIKKNLCDLGPYFGAYLNDLSNPVNNIPWSNRELSLSFIGSFSTHPIRRQIASLVNVFDKTFFEDVSHLNWNGDDLDPALIKDRRVKYNTVLSDSIFSLCPRGVAQNSIRIQESLFYGCCPVLIGVSKDLFAKMPDFQGAVKFYDCLTDDMVVELVSTAQKSVDKSSFYRGLYDKYYSKKAFASSVSSYYDYRLKVRRRMDFVLMSKYLVSSAGLRFLRAPAMRRLRGCMASAFHR